MSWSWDAAVAGLYAALNLDPRLFCAVLNKAGPQHSNSMYAQGGVAAVIQPNLRDDPEQHLKDTLVAGAGLCDEHAVRVLVDEAWSNIEQLIEMKVPFDRRDGALLLTRERRARPKPHPSLRRRRDGPTSDEQIVRGRPGTGQYPDLGRDVLIRYCDG